MTKVKKMSGWRRVGRFEHVVPGCAMVQVGHHEFVRNRSPALGAGRTIPVSVLARERRSDTAHVSSRRFPSGGVHLPASAVGPGSRPDLVRRLFAVGDGSFAGIGLYLAGRSGYYRDWHKLGGA